MEIFLGLVVLCAVIGAILLRRRVRAEQAATGLPMDARVVYSDTGAWKRVEKPLYSPRYRLAGKPDYIVQEESGALIPIEVKPNRGDTEPRYSDTMQLMAYGVLLEEKFGRRPEYGLLKYRQRVFEITFTDSMESDFFQLLEEMRALRNAQNIPRSHNEAVRCRYCGYRQECDERLS